MNNPEDGGRQSEGPVIAIYRHPHRPGIYRVEIEGKEIERMRSFDLHIHNDQAGIGTGGSHYTVEQYMPLSPRAKRAKEELGRRFRKDGQRDIERRTKPLLEQIPDRDILDAAQEHVTGESDV